MSEIKLPKGWNEEKLKSEKSILWSDVTLYEDFQLIRVLVDNIVVGDNKHKNACVEKIFLNIQTSTWQNQYPVRSFIFLIYYSYDISIFDIKTMFACQALEIIYYLKIGVKRSDNFKEKVEELYQNIYSLDFKTETANIIRIIRNNVAHAGRIDGIWDKLSLNDQIAVTNFLADNNLKNIRSIAFSFYQLVCDMIIRILGLDLDDLDRNGLQPFNSKYFKDN